MILCKKIIFYHFLETLNFYLIKFVYLIFNIHLCIFDIIVNSYFINTVGSYFINFAKVYYIDIIH